MSGYFIGHNLLFTYMFITKYDVLVYINHSTIIFVCLNFSKWLKNVDDICALGLSLRVLTTGPFLPPSSVPSH